MTKGAQGGYTPFFTVKDIEKMGNDELVRMDLGDIRTIKRHLQKLSDHELVEIQDSGDRNSKKYGLKYRYQSEDNKPKKLDTIDVSGLITSPDELRKIFEVDNMDTSGQNKMSKSTC
jgi:hypothetical protein